MSYDPSPGGESPSRNSVDRDHISGAVRRVVIGRRDEALFGDLFLARAMARDQIRALFGCSAQRCNDRLRRLTEAEYLRRWRFG